jgi:DNA-binding Lrp family transcriptional regulator
MAILDDLDKKILQNLTNGTCSYEELAHTCSVTRNTVYRRIASLENRGVIRNITSCIINPEQLDISPVCIGVRIGLSNLDKVFQLLSKERNIKFLWRTYGDHNISLVAFCPKGKEGESIQKIKKILEEFGADHVCVSIGFAWEKNDTTSIDIPLETENELGHVIKSMH